MTEKKRDCWEIDPLDGRPTAAWMLIDPHRGGYVIAIGGMTAFHIGDEILGEEVLVWMQERRRVFDKNILLIPIGDEAWFVLTPFYLSTGLLLLTRLPAHAGDSRVLADEDLLGQVSVFEGTAEKVACERGFDRRPALRWWRRICACLPIPVAAEQELEETTRLLRATASLNEIRIGRVTAFQAPPSSQEIAAGQLDPYALTVLLLLSLSALRGSGIRHVTPHFEPTEEGTVLVLTAGGIDTGLHPEESVEILFCRMLAEQNDQIFSFSVQDGRAHLMLCTVRKDFALLGVKTEPDLL